MIDRHETHLWIDRDRIVATITCRCGRSVQIAASGPTTCRHCGERWVASGVAITRERHLGPYSGDRLEVTMQIRFTGLRPRPG